MNIHHFLLTCGTAALLSTAASSEIIIGFHSPGNEDPGAATDTVPDDALPDVSGQITDGRGFATTAAKNSSDGTYGATGGAANATTNNGIDLQVTVEEDIANPGTFKYGNFSRRVVDLTVTNNTGAPLNLGAIHFDYRRVANAPDAFSVIYKATESVQSLGPDDVTFGSATDLPALDAFADHDFPLTGLTTTALADGASAVFRVTFTFDSFLAAATGPGSSARGQLDNIAITSATAAPSAFDLRILSATTTATIEWDSTPTGLYDVYASDTPEGDLLTTWTLIADDYPSAGAVTSLVEDLTLLAPPSPGARFYRVVDVTP